MLRTLEYFFEFSYKLKQLETLKNNGQMTTDNGHDLKITIANNLRLSDIPPKLGETLMETLRFPNPKWLENERLGRWNRGTPQELRFFDKIRGGGLWIPRGYIRQLILLCRRDGIPYQIDDRRRSLPEVSLTLTVA